MFCDISKHSVITGLNFLNYRIAICVSLVQTMQYFMANQHVSKLNTVDQALSYSFGIKKLLMMVLQVNQKLFFFTKLVLINEYIKNPLNPKLHKQNNT